MQNPLLELNTPSLPQFDHIKAEHIEPAVNTVLTENKAAIDKLLQQPHFTWQNLMQPLEAIDDRINYLWAIVSHINAVVNSPEVRNAYNICLPKMSEYSTAMGQNVQLFTATQSLTKDKDFVQYLPVQRKIIHDELRDFHLSGVDLPAEQKQRYAQLQKQLSALMNKFEENLLDATQGWTRLVTNPQELVGIPENAVQAAAENARRKNRSGWLFTLEAPSYIAIMTYAASRQLREEMYTAYVTRASDQGPNAKRWDNTPIMQEILTIRLELAKLLGFQNYAELSLATKTAKSTQQVIQFLNQLIDFAKPIAEREFATLSQFAKQQFNIEQIQAWDVAYLSEKLRQQQYAISDEELRPYFSEDQVLAGLFAIVKRLFGIYIQEKKNVSTWHKDVRFFAMYDAAQNLIGQFYLDLYARENKRGGAWMEEGRSRRRLPEKNLQIPIAFLTCNFTRPVGNNPALFTHDEVLTLFHEFGHGLHQLLSKIDFADASGTRNVPWDVVEFPSQFLENWCWEKSGLDLIAKHYKTGNPLPADLMHKLQATRSFHAGIQTLRQLEFALFDFRLHMEFDPQQINQAQTILDQVRAKLLLYPTPAFNRFQHSFSHIFASSYAAGYYSYKWAEVWAADAFSLFEERGIFDPTTGKAFLDKILSQGSSADPMQMFIAFRGREPKMDALLRHMQGTAPDETRGGELR